MERKLGPIYWFGIIPILGVQAYLSFAHLGFELDGGLFYLRCIRNFLDGHGLCFNPDERVNVLSSPLFVGLAVAASALLGESPAVLAGISGVFFLAATLLFSAVFARMTSVYAAVFGGFALLCIPYPYFTFGIETTLFMALCAAGLLSWDRRQYAILGICCGLLVATRAEGLILVLALAVQHVREKRPMPGWRSYVAPVLIVFGVIGVNWWYYGSLIPSTLGARMAQGASGLWGRWPAFGNFGYHYEVMFRSSDYVIAVGLVLLAIGWLRTWRQPMGIVITLFLVYYTAAYLILNLPNHHWYYAPYYFFGAYFSGAGAWFLAERAMSISEAWPRRLAIAALTGITGWALIASLSFTRGIIFGDPIAFEARGIMWRAGYRVVGEWLRENTPEDSKIAAAEVGMLGYYSDRYMVDIGGIATPGNARYLAQGDVESWFAESGADYVVTHNPLWRIEHGAFDAALDRHLVVWRDFREHGLLVFRAPGAKVEP